jgi:hypothetical protein
MVRATPQELDRVQDVIEILDTVAAHFVFEVQLIENAQQPSDRVNAHRVFETAAERFAFFTDSHGNGSLVGVLSEPQRQRLLKSLTEVRGSQSTFFSSIAASGERAEIRLGAEWLVRVTARNSEDGKNVLLNGELERAGSDSERWPRINFEDCTIAIGQTAMVLPVGPASLRQSDGEGQSLGGGKLPYLFVTPH